jgi:Cu(I)/Ag(I) efflux system protein CusF
MNRFHTRTAASIPRGAAPVARGLVLAAALAAAWPAAASGPRHAQAAVAAAPLRLAQAAPADAYAQAEVRRVDRDGRKLTLKHGEIRNLDMPPMTMVFQVSDPAMLDAVKVGDTIRFKAIERSGTYVVTEIQKGP